MKRCSQCNRIYPKDTLKFCLSDGTPLLSFSETTEEASVIRLLPYVQQTAPLHQGVNPVFAYLAIGLFALVVGGAIIMWIKYNPTDQSPVLQNTVVAKESTNERNIEVVEYSNLKPEPLLLTADAVRNVLINWESAQNNKDFASYQACYDSSFVGVKSYKTGSSQTLGYNAWMADRRRMLANAVNLNVDIANLRIRVESNTAIAEFDQYYRSLRYSDWGPKEIKMRMTPSGAKIVYEELKVSYPL